MLFYVPFHLFMYLLSQVEWNITLFSVPESSYFIDFFPFSPSRLTYFQCVSV